MEKSKINSIVKRVVTAMVMIPVTIGVLYAGYPYIQVAALIVGGMMAWEWAHMVPNSGNGMYGVTYAVAASIAVLFDCPTAIATVMIGASLLVWIKAKNEERRGLLTLGVAYTAIGIGSLVWLYGEVGFVDTMWFLLMVWSVDTGGYVVGSNLKGPKLAPKISPNKTWSGLIGGVLLAMAVSWVYVKNVGADQQVLTYVIYGGIIAVIAQIGDLAESYIKRKLGVKDSSNLIPGHGGIFDRVDGLIFAAPLVFLLFKYGIGWN